MATKKAGCILLNLENNCIGLVYRDYYNDYSFAKGHLEEGETIVECAIRETAEETKRVAEVIDADSPIIEEYTTPKGEDCICYYYIAIDRGHSDNDSTDVHELVWVKFDEVENILSFNQSTWAKAKPTIINLIENYKNDTK